MSKKYDIVGIGNSIVDILCFVDDDFISNYNLHKGSMFLIDDKNANIFSDLEYKKISSGGSVANSISTIAMLGLRTALIGKVANDKFGDIFFDDLKNIGCHFYCKNRITLGKTAQSFILVTPDGERTMCTHLGVASDIKDEIDEEIILNSNILYIEGYLWDDIETITAIKKSIKIAKDNNIKVAFTLSDIFCVQRHKIDFLHISKDIDILFANELEIEALIGDDFSEDNYKKVKNFISDSNLGLIIVMTRGNKGVIIFESIRNIYQVPTKKVDNIVDVTGAGDNFAAGFLYAVAKNIDFNNAAIFGNLLAGEVIKKIGARLDKEEIIKIF